MSTTQTNPSARRSLQQRITHPGVVAFALLLSVAWMLVWNLSPTLIKVPFGTLSVDEWFKYHIDFDVYREGAKAYLAGDNLYTRDYSVWGINLPFTYPPLAAILFTPFVLVPVNLGGALLNVLTAVLLWHVLAVVAKRVLPDWDSSAHLALATVVLPLMLILEPVRQTMSFAQVNVLLMWMVVIDTVPKQKKLPRGLLVGLAAAIKLTPAVFGLYFLIKRDWRAAITSVASGLAFSAIAWVFAPTSSKTYWFETLRDPGRIGVLEWPSNQSIQGVLSRAGADSKMLWLLLCLLTIALVAWVMWRCVARGADAAAVVANSTVALLCSPVSWSHHWVWMAPALLLMIMATVRYRSGLLAALSLVFAFIAISSPHWGMPREDGLELTWSVLQQCVGNAYVWLSVLVLLVMALVPTGANRR